VSPSRPRVLEAHEIAANLRTTFTDKPLKRDRQYHFSWPTLWQHIGDSLAVAYASDKWKDDGEFELYKHLAESPNRVLCIPHFLYTYRQPRRPIEVVGPTISLAGVPMPKHFALLGYFEEADLRLYTGGTNERPTFGEGKDDGVVQVRVRHGYVGASKILWSRQSRRPDQPFLVVFTESGGPVMLIVGTELDIENDGIVG
jgi:hypothetical protein